MQIYFGGDICGKNVKNPLDMSSAFKLEKSSDDFEKNKKKKSPPPPFFQTLPFENQTLSYGPKSVTG